MTRLACAFQVALITLVAILTAPVVIYADTLTGSIVDAQGLALVNANVRLLDRTSSEQRSHGHWKRRRLQLRRNTVWLVCHRGRCRGLGTHRVPRGERSR